MYIRLVIRGLQVLRLLQMHTVCSMLKKALGGNQKRDTAYEIMNPLLSKQHIAMYR
jgi:hypothetical protein